MGLDFEPLVCSRERRMPIIDFLPFHSMGHLRLKPHRRRFAEAEAILKSPFLNSVIGTAQALHTL